MNRRTDKPSPIFLDLELARGCAYSPRFRSTRRRANTATASDEKWYARRCTSRPRQVDAVPASSTSRSAGRGQDLRGMPHPIARKVLTALGFSPVLLRVGSGRIAKAFLPNPTTIDVFPVRLPRRAARFQVIPA